MKLTVLLSSIYFISVNAGLRSPPETNLVVEDSNELVYDDASNHQRELETHHRRNVPHDDHPSNRSLGSDPLLPGISISTRNNCSSNQRGVRIGERAIAHQSWTLSSQHYALTHLYFANKTQWSRRIMRGMKLLGLFAGWVTHKPIT